MNKVDLLIDTNALSHIASITVDLNKKGANRWLWDIFNVHVCRTVRDEFLKHISKASPNSKEIGRVLKSNKENKNGKKILQFVKNTSEIESRWLFPHYYSKTLGTQDQGERHLICSAVELTLKNKFNRIIIVVDEAPARSFINHVISDTKCAELWTTLDLLVYMFFSKSNVREGFIKEAIRDIAGASSFPIKEWKKKGIPEAVARLELIKHYGKKIDQIKKLQQIVSK